MWSVRPVICFDSAVTSELPICTAPWLTWVRPVPEPPPWTLIWAPLQPLYRAGEYEQVADRLETELPEDATWQMLHYNAACIYSLTGRKEKALTHLTKAMELAPDNVRGYAENDDDLANIRDEPKFQELFAP